MGKAGVEPASLALQASANPPQLLSQTEREGFEPPSDVFPIDLSRIVPSATRPPLQCVSKNLSADKARAEGVEPPSLRFRRPMCFPVTPRSQNGVRCCVLQRRGQDSNLQ